MHSTAMLLLALVNSGGYELTVSFCGRRPDRRSDEMEVILSLKEEEIDFTNYAGDMAKVLWAKITRKVCDISGFSMMSLDSMHYSSLSETTRIIRHLISTAKISDLNNVKIWTCGQETNRQQEWEECESDYL